MPKILAPAIRFAEKGLTVCNIYFEEGIPFREMSSLDEIGNSMIPINRVMRYVFGGSQIN